MALAIHGTPVGTLDTSGTNTTISATITTTVPDTIIIAVIANFEQTTAATLRTVTGVSGGGLTWTKRSAQSATANIGSVIQIGLEVWWAHATGTLTSQAITATFNAAPNQRSEIAVFAVSGSNHLSAPWDTNASLPATASSAGSTLGLPTLPSMSTTATNDLLFGFLAYAKNGNGDATVGSGMTSIVAITDNSLGSVYESKAVASSGGQTAPFVNNEQFWVVAGDALNGAAASGNTGTITTSLTKASQSLAGAEKFTGTISTALKKASQSLAGAEKFTGTISTALTKASQSLAGTEKIIASSITTNLTKLSQSLAGKETFTGTVNTALIKLSQSAFGFNGNAGVTGTLVTTLRGIAVAAIAEEDFVASAVTRLGKVAMAATAEEDFIGHVVTRLGNESGQMVGNIVQAEEIILGPITMALPPFRPLILGAKLGMPGAGKWYSWRHTDS